MRAREDSLHIAVTMDYDKAHGFFMKPDLYRCFTEKKVRLVPLTYDPAQLQGLLDQVDGVLIPGGVSDVDPEFYGEKVLYERVKVLKERYEFEKQLLDLALPRKMPLLCICWGMQMLNVYLGGSLFQDIATQCASELAHEQPEAGHIPTHFIQFEAGGEGEKLFGTRKYMVNSTHHQAVDRLSKDLILEARADDGLVEAARIRDYPSGWAVQWHPERLANEPIIPAFLEACRRSRS